MDDAEELLQQRFVVALNSGADTIVDGTLQQLAVVTYGNNLVLVEHVMLVDCLLRCLQNILPVPVPPSFLLAGVGMGLRQQMSVGPEIAAGVGGKELNEMFPSIRNGIGRLEQILKIFFNLSCVRGNRQTMAQHKPLVVTLLALLKEDLGKDSECNILELLANLAKHIQFTLEEVPLLNSLVTFLQSSDRDHKRCTLRFFQKIASQNECNAVFARVPDAFFTEIVSCLLLPVGLSRGLAPVTGVRRLDRDTAEELQERALSVVYSISSMTGRAHVRTCQFHGLLEALVVLLRDQTKGAIGRRASICILNFAEDLKNRKQISSYLQEFVSLSLQRDSPSCRIINKLLDRLSVDKPRQ